MLGGYFIDKFSLYFLQIRITNKTKMDIDNDYLMSYNLFKGEYEKGDKLWIIF
jgi:hypothetical protein